MRKLKGTVLIIAVVFTIVLLAPPALISSAENVKVFYDEVSSINVSFPDGKEIEKGGKLTIVISSSIFDLKRSGITFFECDRYGNPLTTSSMSPPSTSEYSGNTATHVFFNLKSDIRINFSDLKFLDPENLSGSGEDETDKKPGEVPGGTAGGDIGLTTVVIAIAAAVAAIMFAISMVTMRRIDAIIKEWETAS
jgi:hypothetical protein